MSYPVPENEISRLAALESYQVVDSLAEQEYDDIVLLLANICQTPIATIAFLDEDRKWHKAKYGIDKDAVPRDSAICAHTILQTPPLVVNNTLEHPVFSQIGMVTNPPFVRFYAGVALINQQGYSLGTLCTIDTQPRTLEPFQLTALEALGRQVVALLELRRSVQMLNHRQTELENKQKQLDELNSQLAKSSMTDELSGLWNRRAMEQKLSQGDFCSSLALLMLDLDNFKLLNDRFGHDCGDMAIQLLSDVLTDNTREADFCVRFGGDEFIVLMPDITLEQATRRANDICSKISQLHQLPDTISVSVGIAFGGEQGCCPQSLKKLADQCLYEAKHQGKNCVVANRL